MDQMELFSLTATDICRIRYSFETLFPGLLTLHRIDRRFGIFAFRACGGMHKKILLIGYLHSHLQKYSVNSNKSSIPDPRTLKLRKKKVINKNNDIQ